MNSNTQSRHKLSVKEMALFAVLGAIMFALKTAMQFLPNIHLVGVLIVTFTIVYRAKALIPIYVYVFLDGIFGGLFSGLVLWWLPYLYIWAVLWGVTMLLPKNMPTPVAAVLYPLVCGLHGLAFGTLYAPMQALMFGLNFKATVAWIIAGLPFDIIHAVSNTICGFIILPLSKAMIKINKAYRII